MRYILPAALIALLCAGCTPDCIRCQDIENYPDALICRDTYQTTIVDGAPDWAEYSEAALEAGCTRE